MAKKTYRTTSRGVFYFPTRELALRYADAIGAPLTGVRAVGMGYAIQWHVSGPYVGPKTLTHPPGSCAWCPKPPDA